MKTPKSKNLEDITNPEENVLVFVGKNRSIYSFNVAYKENPKDYKFSKINRLIDFTNKKEYGDEECDYNYAKFAVFKNQLICAFKEDYLFPLNEKKESNKLLSIDRVTIPFFYGSEKLFIKDIIVAKDKFYAISSIEPHSEDSSTDIPIILESKGIDDEGLVFNGLYSGKISSDLSADYAEYMDDTLYVSMDCLVKIGDKLGAIYADIEEGIFDYKTKEKIVDMKGYLSHDPPNTSVGIDGNYLYINANQGNYQPSYMECEEDRNTKGIYMSNLKTGLDEGTILSECGEILGFEFIPKKIFENLDREYYGKA